MKIEMRAHEVRDRINCGCSINEECEAPVNLCSKGPPFSCVSMPEGSVTRNTRLCVSIPHLDASLLAGGNEALGAINVHGVEQLPARRVQERVETAQGEITLEMHKKLLHSVQF